LLAIPSPQRVFFSIVFGALAGMTYSIVIPLVLMSLQPNTLQEVLVQPEEVFFIGAFEVSQPRFAIAFFVLCILIFLLRSASQIIFNRVAIDSAKLLREYFYQRLAVLPIESIEKLGVSRLHTVLQTDIPQIIEGAAFYPNILINLSTTFGLLGLIAYLDLGVFFFIISVIIFGLLTYRVPIYLSGYFLSRARKVYDHIQSGFVGLIYGAKELKLNSLRKKDFVEQELRQYEREYAALQKKGGVVVVSAMNYGNLISLLSIGLVTFVAAKYYSLSRETLINSVMVLLYISMPLNVLMNSVRPVIKGKIALKNLNHILTLMPQEEVSEAPAINSVLELSFKGVYYQRSKGANSESAFEIGPIDLSIQRGELLFITGGNGSGKSTLGNLLALFYHPSGGDVMFDGQLVDSSNRDQYRQLISAIGTDFHLFKKLFGVSDIQLESVSKYLAELELNDKVSIENAAFSDINLSSGQRKRLALVVAYLDDRDIYIFDEWAADQDPRFKKIFYEEILPDLRAKNKIVVTITHDDSYFSLADRLMVMENGKIIEIRDQRKNKGKI